MRNSEGAGQEDAAPQRLFEGLFGDLGNAARRKTEDGQPLEPSQTDEERTKQLREARRMSLGTK